MLEIAKSELIPLMVAYYRRQLEESAYKIYLLQEKYGCSLMDFEKEVKTRKEEDFSVWDDYLDWKGHSKSAAHLSEKIKAIEHGLFEIA